MEKKLLFTLCFFLIVIVLLIEACSKQQALINQLNQKLCKYENEHCSKEELLEILSKTR